MYSFIVATYTMDMLMSTPTVQKLADGLKIHIAIGWRWLNDLTCWYH